MTKIYRRIIVALLTVVIVFTAEVYAETFEFLTYTPPKGWTKQMSADGPVYRRTSGVGLISFYASYPTTALAPDEFARAWQARIGAALSIPAPQPKVESDGDYKIAIGAQNVDAQGTMTAVSLVTIVGRGRSISFSAVAAGPDVLNEVTAFFDTIKINPGPAASAPQTSAGTIDVDFDLPKGYTSTRDGSAIVIKPATVDRATPCVYGLSPARATLGDLAADARAALLEPLPGWQIKSDHYNAMRGVSGAGWQYYWLRTDVQQMSGSSMQYLTAMAMAFSSAPGRVNILWGFGATGPCTLDDHSFLQLFFSLRPRGWTSDGGKSLAAQLHGLWRDTQNTGMAQYRFRSDGRYAYEYGTSTTFGNLETRTGSASDGRWQLRGSDLTFTGGRRGGSKLRVRVYDEYLGGVWRRGMSLLDESAKPPLEVHYMRIEE